MKFSKISNQQQLDFITLKMAKRQLNIIDDDTDDLHITLLAETAMRLAEKATKRLLSRGDVTLSVKGVYSFFLPYGETDSITSCQVNGEDIGFDYDDVSGRINIDRSAVTGDDYIRIVYTTGYEQGEVPKPIVMGALALISTLYEIREDVIAGMTDIELPLGSRTLFDSYKLSEI